MADQQQTLKGAIVTLNPKIVLAFFLVLIASGLTVWMGTILVAGKADAGTAAVISGVVMIFVKMAADACGYQTQSSAGSDKKDDAQTAVSKALAEKVPTPTSPTPVAMPPVSPPPTPPSPWWSRLSDAEKNAVTVDDDTDARTKAIVTAMTTGAATPDDLAYLVSKNLLTKERASEIEAA